MSQYGPLPLAPASPRPYPHDHNASTDQYFKAMGHEYDRLSESQSRKSSRIRLRGVFPTLLVFISTAGLGLAVLVWLFTKLKIPASEAFRRGYLLVDEGVKHSEDSMESATLRALTATSFLSTIITATAPILMALIAYRIACIWVAEERKPVSDQRKEPGPTPLQYGLLVEVLSASSVMSLYEGVLYLFRGRSRARAPSYFVTAVLLGVAVYTLTHLVGLADLWLHSTTSAVVYNLTVSGDAPILKTSLAFNESRCTQRYYITGGGRGICLTSDDGWAYEPDQKSWIPMGQAVIANYSLDRQAITLADEGDLAIVVPKSIDRLATFRASTFGAYSQCRIITSECGFKTGSNIEKNCSNLGITAIPTADTPLTSVALVAPYDKWNGTVFSPGNHKYGPATCCLTNPVQSLLQIRWGSQINGPVDVPNTAVWGQHTPLLDIYALCNLTFYNMTVAYDGRAADGKYWSAVPGGKTLSTEAFASTLAGPFSWQLIMDTLTSNIKSRAMLSTSNEQVEAAINQELSRLALGFVSDAFYFDAATDVTVYQPTILGRYPITPLLIFVALLVIYGLIALIVFGMSVDSPPDVISVPPSLQDPSSGDQSEIPVVELAQMRLLSSLPLVAQMFEPPAHPQSPPNPGDTDAKSVALTETELFSEGGSSKMMETRLRLGLEDVGIRPRIAVPNFGPFRDLDDYYHRPDNQRGSIFAQQIFDPNVRSGSLGPYSLGGFGPHNRFAYVFYATKKGYLCNVLINFERLCRYEVAGEFALVHLKAWERKARDKYKANLHFMDVWSTHQGDPTWSDSLTKLYVFGLTDYTRIIYLGSDGLVLNNLDHLFIAPQARIALPRTYWLEEEGKLASHIMVITPGQSLVDRWVNTGGSAVGFDMEVVNKPSASSSLILPHRGYAMLTGEFRNTNHSRYLTEDGPDAEWNPHAEMSALHYIHFSDWPLPKPWFQASKDQIEKVQPACDPKEQVSCWNREHWHSVYEMYEYGRNKVCIN